MEFERLCRVLREQRRRIVDLRDSELGDDDAATLMVEQSLYDARLIDLACMLDVPLPERVRDDGGLDADHRSVIEDHLAEQGVDLRPE